MIEVRFQVFDSELSTQERAKETIRASLVPIVGRKLDNSQVSCEVSTVHDTTLKVFLFHIRLQRLEPRIASTAVVLYDIARESQYVHGWFANSEQFDAKLVKACMLFGDRIK
jgi:hypothetical protein